MKSDLLMAKGQNHCLNANAFAATYCYLYNDLDFDVFEMLSIQPFAPSSHCFSFKINDCIIADLP